MLAIQISDQISRNNFHIGLSHCAYHLQAQVYREDFALERHDREVAHGKLTDLKRKYTSEVEELKAQLAQIE